MESKENEVDMAFVGLQHAISNDYAILRVRLWDNGMFSVDKMKNDFDQIIRKAHSSSLVQTDVEFVQALNDTGIWIVEVIEPPIVFIHTLARGV